MQFVSGGPDIPLEVLQAHEAGELVFFCGAGVSIRAGLPSFGGLAEKVIQNLQTRPNQSEQREIQEGNYDRVFTLLESDGRFSPKQVRAEVRKILTVPSNPIVDTHKAILDLSTDRNGRVRLVTTNFDLLFQEADSDVPVTAAPLLPVPKIYKWDSLVHLHGHLSERDEEGQHLVLTSADFGIAYLVERWASRFVSELFNHCAVLFVGYRVEDPVMRYLIDALAAERKSDERIHGAFALASCGTNGEASEKEKWLSKHLTPILYSDANQHEALHQTLKAWAGIWSGGLNSKLNIVLKSAPTDPVSMTDEAIQQFCWAVSDSSGVMAKKMAQLKKGATLEWLPVFDSRGLTSGSQGEDTPEQIPLVDHGEVCGPPPRLDKVRYWIACWLAEHVESPSLARWVVSKGACIHPDLRRFLEWKLDEASGLTGPLRKAWTALIQAARRPPVDHSYSPFVDSDLIATAPRGPALSTMLAAVFHPIPVFQSSWKTLGIEEPDDDDQSVSEGLTVSSLFSFDCTLAAGSSLPLILEKLADRTDWTEVLCEHAFDFANLLKNAMDLQASVDSASNDQDYSFIHHPSVESHEQNRGFHTWTILIDLNRDAIERLAATNSTRARALIGFWEAANYPVFRRLVLHSANKHDLPTADQLLGFLEADPWNWLWSVAIQVELYSYLPKFWSALSQQNRTKLGEVILDGPPRENYQPDLSAGEWEDLRDRSIWNRLARIRRGARTLGPVLDQKLRALEDQHPEWRLSGDAREDFPTWIESSWGLPTDYSVKELSEMENEELITTLVEHETNREGLIDSWRDLATADQERALRLCTEMVRRGFVNGPLLAAGLGGFREPSTDMGLQGSLMEFLVTIPEDLLGDETLSRTVSAVLRAVGKTLAPTEQPRFLSMWDTAFAASLSIESTKTDNRVFDAINHPTGVLAEALLELPRARSIRRGEGIPSDIRSSLQQVTDTEGEPACLGRVILASRLPYLFDIDPEWTRSSLIRFFAWDDPDEAQGSWQGFLWSPWLRPSLWDVLKQHFLESFDNLAALGRAAEKIGSLLASVAIEGDDALSQDESRECLGKLDSKGREAVSIWLGRSLEGAGGQSGVLWLDRIGPWLSSAWPREPRYRNEATSEGLAVAAILAGNQFANAVEVVRHFLSPIERGTVVLRKLREHDLPMEEPGPCLELINALTPDNPPVWYGELSQFLDSLNQDSPGLVERPEYVRLREIAIAGDL